MQKISSSLTFLQSQDLTESNVAFFPINKPRSLGIIYSAQANGAFRTAGRTEDNGGFRVILNRRLLHREQKSQYLSLINDSRVGERSHSAFKPSLLSNLLRSRWCRDSISREMGYVVLSFLLNQLSTFLREESDLLGGLRHEVQHIKDELGQMKGFLRRVEALAQNTFELEAWVSQVRDVAYDAEDVLDEFVLRFGRHYGDGFLNRVWKFCGLIKNLKARHQIATKIRAIKVRIRNISEAHQRYQNQYGVFELGSNFDGIHNVWHDRRGDALLLEETDLVGIERPKEKLLNMLLTNDSQLRVISVVGMGGLGKTTVVKKVYDDVTVKNRFKHHAWITVSQSFKLETLLNQAIRQIFKELNQPVPLDQLDTMDLSSIKQLVRDLLRQKKYIFVFDDIWRTTDWDAIRMVFPKDDCGSRIMITTRSIEVGQAATSDIIGNIYHLEPLSKDDSTTLFCKKVFRAASCPSHLEEISETITERCAGLPLAIVVIGGVLATRSRRTEEWELFNRSLGVEMAHNNQLDNMTKLLSLSYYDLPDYLRICFLYLSILPEDFPIEDTKLVRLWIAEGFVQKTEGMTIEEVAEGYLNELINRSLVQVDETTLDQRVRRYRVHDIVQQTVLRKAKEQDITTISSERGMQFSNRVRRLVIHGSIDNNTQVSYGLFKSLRSLLLFESTNSMTILFLSKLLSEDPKLLKVLDLRGAPLEVIPDEIFKLLQLKYLSLRETKIKTVPRSVGELQNLETLDLKYTNVTKLPVEILKLLQLRHLLMRTIFGGFQAPYRIGNLQSLRSLCYIDADETRIIVREIGKLTHLRRLAITNLRKEVGKELCSSLEKLTNLRSLYIISRKQEEVIDLQHSLSSIPRFLQTLKLRGRLEKAPKWLPSLHGLTGVCLLGSQLRDDPLQLLQDLPNLVELVLGQAYEGEGLCFRAGRFPRLKKLWIMNLQGLKWVRMEKGTMPFLEKLWMADCKLVEDLPMGIEHLANLRALDFTDMSESFVKMLEDIEKESAEYKRIAHIPQVVISSRVDGEFKQRYLSIRREMSI